MSAINDKAILVTGATGSFGKKFIEVLLRDHSPRKIIVFSRDELKQFEMAKKLQDPRIRWFLGDVRDSERLHRAFYKVDIVVHAAALKQVPMLEYNPFEAVKTNIMGAQNIINAAIDCGVQKVIALSTDKAVNPINLYGATKLCAEKLFVDANAYVSYSQNRFSVVRYGNVLGSRGSVVPYFWEKRDKGVLHVTDKRMTRFWITLEQGVKLVIQSLEMMKGGEIFIPKIPSMRTIDIATAIAPKCKIEYTGIRPGEKLDEILLTEDEARHAFSYKDVFVIYPEHPWWTQEKWEGSTPLKEGFRYASDNNEAWLKIDEIKAILEKEGFSDKAEAKKNDHSLVSGLH